MQTDRHERRANPPCRALAVGFGNGCDIRQIGRSACPRIEAMAVRAVHPVSPVAFRPVAPDPARSDDGPAPPFLRGVGSGGAARVVSFAESAPSPTRTRIEDSSHLRQNKPLGWRHTQACLSWMRVRTSQRSQVDGNNLPSHPDPKTGFRIDSADSRTGGGEETSVRPCVPSARPEHSGLSRGLDS